jgi:hypothetical protein
MIARGTFEVTMTPQGPYEPVEGVVYGRFTVKKIFSGDIEGEATAEMLTAGSSTIKGSAVYVAIDRVTARVAGRAGTFALQHAGLMRRGEASLTVVVVPDSATGDLVGLAGTMTIDIVDGRHFYALTYELPAEDAR